MKKRINRQLMLISSMAVAIMLLLMTAVFHHIFRGQVMDDLRLYAYAVAQSIEAEAKLGHGYSYRGQQEETDRNVRATIISRRVRFSMKAMPIRERWIIMQEDLK